MSTLIALAPRSQSDRSTLLFDFHQSHAKRATCRRVAVQSCGNIITSQAAGDVKAGGSKGSRPLMGIQKESRWRARVSLVLSLGAFVSRNAAGAALGQSKWTSICLSFKEVDYCMPGVGVHDGSPRSRAACSCRAHVVLNFFPPQPEPKPCSQGGA